jgi:hypothetical protein
MVRRPTVPQGRKRRLEDGEEERLLAACDRGRTPLLKQLVILAIETGMRRGELLGLRWEYGSRFHSLRLSHAGSALEIVDAAGSSAGVRAFSRTSFSAMRASEAESNQADSEPGIEPPFTTTLVPVVGSGAATYIKKRPLRRRCYSSMLTFQSE